MKLACPKCLSHLKVPSERIPAGGGWARCPKCAERFYVQAPGAALDLLSEPPRTTSAQQGLRRDESSQRLLNHLRTKRGEEARDGRGFDLDFSEITIFPEPALSPAACQTLGIILLVLPLVVLLAFFFKADQPPPSVVTVESAKIFNNELNPDLIRADLLWVRNQTIHKKRLETQIDFTGSESRIFKYFAADMVPGVCDAITWLEIESDRPTKGFEATAACREGSSRRLVMKLSWTDRTAIISFPGYSTDDWEVDLFPAQPAATKKNAQGG